MSEEDINLPTWGKCLISLLIGLGLGIWIMSFYSNKTDYRSPSELADYLEEMLFEYKHTDDIQHGHVIAMLKNDATTLGDVKRWYKIYNATGVSRIILESQINVICYKKEWKD